MFNFKVLKSKIKRISSFMTYMFSGNRDTFSVFYVVQIRKPCFSLKMSVTLWILSGVKRENYYSIKSKGPE